MKRRSYPVWLMRDVPALLGVLFSFWPLMILAMIMGRRAMRGKRTRKSSADQLSILLAHAEARLAHALWRQAFRHCGFDPRAARLTLLPLPTSWNETLDRLQNYRLAFQNMHQVVDVYVEDLRQRYGIRKAALVAHGSTDAALCAAAHHELVGAAALLSPRSPFALILSSAQSARPSKDERGSTHARGPPNPYKSAINSPPASSPARA